MTTPEPFTPADVRPARLDPRDVRRYATEILGEHPSIVDLVSHEGIAAGLVQALCSVEAGKVRDLPAFLAALRAQIIVAEVDVLDRDIAAGVSDP